VNSELTDEFLACFRRLPDRIKRQARKTYAVWKIRPHHPSLEFKRVGKRSPIYSVLWFWIGSHAEYDHLLRQGF